MDWTNVNFFKGLFLDDDGAPSMGRVITPFLFAIAVFCILWVTVRSDALPPAAESLALLTGAASLYVANRATAGIGQ